VTHISEHDTEEEGEGHTGKDCWVNFFVGRNTICIDDFLESPCESIDPEHARWLDVMLQDQSEGGNFHIDVLLPDFLQIFVDLGLVSSGDPAVPMEESALLLKLVETGIEGLLLIEEELIELDKGDGVLNGWVLRDLLDLLEELSQSESGGADEILRVINTSLEVSDAVGHVLLVNGLRNVEVLAHKGITNLY
jgi:hypothetical protein